MAKKIETPTVASSKLIIGKDEFKQQIDDRISKGKELLPSLHGQVYYNQRDFPEYNKWNRFNIELLECSFDVSDNKYKQEYQAAVNRTFLVSKGDDFIKIMKDDIRAQIDVLESFIDRLPLIPTATEPVKLEAKTESKPTNKVFIVHGHDEAIKQTVARTLMQLKLEPVILHERPEQGRTIIEKFERDSSDVNFAIILLTADDEGKAKAETDYKSRARQNVVFEMGCFIGKLGREKVFLLLENGVDKPGDLDGIVYVPIDATDGWKLKLARELKAAGYNVTADDL
jgi:predicted nucleotide-binding protein